MFFLNAFREGGPFMYVILVFALFSLSFVLERGIALYTRFSGMPAGWRSKLNEYLVRGQFQPAENYLLSVAPKASVAQVIAAGCRVRALGGGEEEVQARMDERLAEEIAGLDKRTGFLAMFGNVATLVGLLGTIAGMIHSFAAVAQASPMDRATMLSKGISEAMNCTAFGLIVAVPALVAYAIYQNRTDHLVNQMTQETTQAFHDLIFSFSGHADVEGGLRPTRSASTTLSV